MPNWFNFSLNVSGEKKDVEQFVENVKGSEKFETQGREFDFNHFIPQPENLYRDNLSTDKEKELDELGLPNWYRWNVDNWGTKWNAIDTEVEQRDGTLIYRFNTAWDAPRNIAEALLRMQKTILQDINISWECIHEDGDEEEVLIDIETEYDIKAS